MMWLFAVLLVLAMGVVAMVAAGRGTPLQEEYDDRPDAFVAASGELGAGDLRAVRFSLAVRGYRMAEVDTLLARLAAQLEAAAGEETAVPRALPAGPAADPEQLEGGHAGARHAAEEERPAGLAAEEERPA